MLISLENHCSINQQIRLANDIREILKDNVIICPLNNFDKLPSLRELKYKVIIKVEFKLSFTKSLKTGNDAAIRKYLIIIIFFFFNFFFILCIII